MGSSRGGSQPLAVLALVAVVGFGSAVVARAHAESPSPAAATTSFGTLMSDPAYTAEEAEAGVDVAMLELSWESYEPGRGEWDTDYAEARRGDLRELRASGRRVTLGLGLHESPTWAFDLPHSRLVDQDGNHSEDLNLIFNQALREEAATYLRRIDQDLGLSNFAAVRITSGGNAEVLYPDDGAYWAYDDNAQGGDGRPPSLPPTPLPGWRPGEQTVPTEQVAEWADWYVGALADVVDWQVESLRGFGFTGQVEVLTPGNGVRPREYDEAVADYLPPGLLGSGSVWHRLYALLRSHDNVVAYVSSVADQSGDDKPCEAADDTVPLDSPQADAWGATRWITRIAHEHDLAVAGENPGYGMPPELNDYYRDLTDRGMMAAAFRLLRGCGLHTFYWAHDYRLWDGTVPFAHYAASIDGTT